MAKPPPSSSKFWKLFNVFAALNNVLYRRTGGRLGGKVKGAPVLLLHHVGAKSGQERVAPLLYLADGDRFVIVASKGGTDKNPAWFYNLRAHPQTKIEIGRDKRNVTARIVDDSERERLWPRLVEMYPDYAVYQTHTERQIPVIALEPA